MSALCHSSGIFKHVTKNSQTQQTAFKWLLLQPLQVYNDTYFQVTLDDLSAEAPPCRLVCHAGSPGILPVQWCLKNGVALQRPRGYQGHDFDWADYLKQSGTEAAPDTCFPDVSVKNSFCANGIFLAAVPQVSTW